MADTPKALPKGDTQIPSGVGQGISAENARWTFSDVSASFEDHIEQSIPGYREGHDLIARLSDWFVTDGSLTIELGCSTAALTRRLADWHRTLDFRMVGIEIEPGMAEAARKACADYGNITIVQGDALHVELEPTDLITSYYTMQFVRPAQRQRLYDRVYEALNWGGEFIMFEKVLGPDARFQDILSTLYADFKLDQGFNEAEIMHKTRSLKGVLEPFSTQGNLDLLARAGFKDVMVVWKNLCFEGYLAIK